jgi:hypothetical protein
MKKGGKKLRFAPIIRVCTEQHKKKVVSRQNKKPEGSD